LANLGYKLCDQTVGNVLQRHALPPAPERKRTMTWAAFIRIPSSLTTPATVGALALEIAETGGAAKDRSRVARSHPAHEPGKPKWGASRIHGELLMLGFEAAQSTVI
jgi:hypothetical protein